MRYQKYFLIIRIQPDTQCACCRSPLMVKVTLTFLTRKWMCQASWAISSRLKKEWITASLLWSRAEADVSREAASAAAGVWRLESHSSVQNVFSRQGNTFYPTPSQTGQNARQMRLDIKAQPQPPASGRALRLLPTPSFHFLSSLATTKNHKTHAALLTLAIKLEERVSLAPCGQLCSALH